MIIEKICLLDIIGSDTPNVERNSNGFGSTGKWFIYIKLIDKYYVINYILILKKYGEFIKYCS